MVMTKFFKVGSIFGVVLLGFWLVGCVGSGDTDGSGADREVTDGTMFAGDGSAVQSIGTLTIDVINSNLNVAETSGFRVTLKNADGEPVPQITILCDSEIGIAILEPTTGRELTDSNGTMSGILGCEKPGSFQFACRAASGVGRRQYVDIHCGGDVPSGFAGWSGSSGGTLGSGGVVDNSKDDVNAGVRITKIRAISLNSNSDNYQIDTVQGTTSNGGACGTDPDKLQTNEPFADDFLGVTIVNSTSSRIRFDKLAYEVENGVLGGGQFLSEPLLITCEIDAGASGECRVLFTKASGGSKRFSGGDTNISTDGFSAITVDVEGENVLGETVTVSGSETFSFGDYNNCP